MNIRIKRLEINISLRPVVGFSFHYHYASVRKVLKPQGYYLSSYGFGQSVSFQRRVKAGKHPAWRPDLSWHHKFQLWLQGIGINACDPITQECTPDFSCCLWSVPKSEAGILSELAAQHNVLNEVSCDDHGADTASGVYIARSGPGTCKVCTTHADLRFGTCWDCRDSVACDYDEVSGLTKVMQIGNPENWWVAST